MNLFRNFSIKTRLVLTFLISILFPVSVFGYVNIKHIEVSSTTTFFLCLVSIVIAIVTALLVGSSIISPLHLVQSSLQTFSVRKSCSKISDKGLDEISDITGDINRIYDEWNQEMVTLGKRQVRLDKENERTSNRATTVEAQLAQTRSLFQIAQNLNTTFDFNTNCKSLLDEAINSMNLQWASILLLDRESNEMKVACVRGVERSLLDDLNQDNYPAIKLKPHEGLAGLVIKEGLPLIANKGHKDPRFKQFSEFNSNRDQKVASILCAPIIGKDGNVLGVMNLVNRQVPPIFRNEDIPYAKDLCLLAALIIERNRMYNKLFTDDRTGLLAQNVWNGHLNEELVRAHRYAQNLSVVSFQIDGYKELLLSTNEDFTSNIIASCGKSISKLLRDSDKAASNLDKFYCMLTNTDASGAVFFAGRVKEALEEDSFTFNGKKLKVTLSAGIGSNLEAANEALNKAKAAGGNRAVIA